jgi:hypothetical protein
MDSSDSPDSHDPQDDDFGPSSLLVLEQMSDELWARFVQVLAPKEPAPRSAATAQATPEPDPADICVRASSGSVVKFRPAAIVMDKAPLASAIEAVNADREAASRWDAGHGAQRVWDLYCGRLYENYGHGFTPDTDPVWWPLVLQNWDLEEVEMARWRASSGRVEPSESTS